MSGKWDRSIRYCVIQVLGVLFFGVGAALLVGSSLLYWQGITAVEDLDMPGKLEVRGVDGVSDSDSVGNQGEEKAEVEDDVIAVAVGEEVGEVYFPVLEVGMPVFHGVSEDELAKGVGHVPGSGFPGEGGNIVLSGHRDTVFRRLGELEAGNKIVVAYGDGLYTYKIARIRIVDKEDTSVVVSRPREMLTITTCYPFRFIGSAPERYVLEAEFLGRESGGLIRESGE